MASCHIKKKDFNLKKQHDILDVEIDA